jgi:hypothetical protein
MKLKNMLLLAAFSYASAEEDSSKKIAGVQSSGYTLSVKIGGGAVFSKKNNKKYDELDTKAQGVVERWTWSSIFDKDWTAQNWNRDPRKDFKNNFDASNLSIPGYRIPVSVVGTYGVETFQLEASFSLIFPHFAPAWKLGLSFGIENWKIRPFIGILGFQEYHDTSMKKAYEKSTDPNEKKLAKDMFHNEFGIVLVGFSIERKFTKAISAFVEYEYANSLIIPTHTITLGVNFEILSTAVVASVGSALV